MSTEASHPPTRREITGELFDRLRRVNAASGTIAALLRSHDASLTALTDSLQALEHDLVLAAHAAERARGQLNAPSALAATPSAGIHGPDRRFDADGTVRRDP